MANLHPTTDTDFQNRQYGFELPNPSRTNGQGIRRAVVERSPRTTDQRRTAARPQSFAPGTNTPARRLQTRARNRATPMMYAPANQPELNQRGRKKKIDPAAHAAAVARAVTTSLVIFSWTTMLYFFVQLPFAVFSLVMFGASVLVEGNWLYDAALNIWNATGEIFGFPTIDIMTFFYIGWIATILSGYLCLFGALAQYLFAFLHPLGGEEGSAAKKALFLLAFTFHTLPGFNLFPWVWLWMLAVTRYPK